MNATTTETDRIGASQILTIAPDGPGAYLLPRNRPIANGLSSFLDALKARHPAEREFHQAVTEVAKSVWPFIEKNPKYPKAKILGRMTEPERAITFRVTWIDRYGEVQVNRGYRAPRALDAAYDQRLPVESFAPLRSSGSWITFPVRLTWNVAPAKSTPGSTKPSLLRPTSAPSGSGPRAVSVESENLLSGAKEKSKQESQED